MFLNLNHYKLDVYQSARELRIECYKILSKIPDHEKFNIIDQIRRASTSVLLNITEGCSRKSELERKGILKLPEVRLLSWILVLISLSDVIILK